MINSIIDSIGISLNAEFGDKYTIYSESIEQGLKEPCFFISCLNPTNQLFFDKRYFRQNQFCIQYLPENAGNIARTGCNDVAERLFNCLEYITVENDLVRGTQMKCEIIDDVLHFFVNYDMFIYKKNVVNPMEELSSNLTAKG